MARHEQIIRQWKIMQLLWQSPGLSVAEIMQRLPLDSAPCMRTIRRDLEALSLVFPVQEDDDGSPSRYSLPKAIPIFEHVTP